MTRPSAAEKLVAKGSLVDSSVKNDRCPTSQFLIVRKEQMNPDQPDAVFTEARNITGALCTRN